MSTRRRHEIALHPLWGAYFPLGFDRWREDRSQSVGLIYSVRKEHDNDVDDRVMADGEAASTIEASFGDLQKFGSAGVGWYPEIFTIFQFEPSEPKQTLDKSASAQRSTRNGAMEVFQSERKTHPSSQFYSLSWFQVRDSQTDATHISNKIATWGDIFISLSQVVVTSVIIHISKDRFFIWLWTQMNFESSIVSDSEKSKPQLNIFTFQAQWLILKGIWEDGGDEATGTSHLTAEFDIVQLLRKHRAQQPTRRNWNVPL